MHPCARKENLTIRELSEETLVYDREHGKAHCLNRTAALVWKHCDGQHDLAALAMLLQGELELPAVEAEAAARLALEQLSRRHLLKEPITPLEAERLTRRAALRKIAVATAAALPLVMTLKSPSVAWGANPFPGPCEGFIPGPHQSAQGGRNFNKPDGTPCLPTGFTVAGKCMNGQCVGALVSQPPAGCPAGSPPCTPGGTPCAGGLFCSPNTNSPLGGCCI